MTNENNTCLHCGMNAGLHELTCQQRNHNPSALADSLRGKPAHEVDDAIKRMQRLYGLEFATRVADRLQTKGSN